MMQQQEHGKDDDSCCGASGAITDRKEFDYEATHGGKEAPPHLRRSNMSMAV